MSTAARHHARHGLAHPRGHWAAGTPSPEVSLAVLSSQRQNPWAPRSFPAKLNLPDCKDSSNAPVELFPSPQMFTGPHGHSDNTPSPGLD